MQFFNSELTQAILKEFTSTKLCTFQIAYKFNINQRSIKSLIINNLGYKVFSKKEELAYDNLVNEIRVRSEQNYSSTQIAAELGICRSTCFRIVGKLSHGSSTQLPESAEVIPNASDSVKQNPNASEYIPDKSGSESTDDSLSPVCAANNIIQIANIDPKDRRHLPASYPRRNYSLNTHKQHLYRQYDHQECGKKQMVTVNVNGFSIRFDSSIPGASEVLNKLIAVITE
ncbi:MAG: hypothetical protein K6F05_07100 [Succinivibrio sp.]|nr:hypothetical protein [Succinivibrio sp.]